MAFLSTKSSRVECTLSSCKRSHTCAEGNACELASLLLMSRHTYWLHKHCCKLILHRLESAYN